MARNEFHIGMAQMLVEGGQPAANLDRAERFVADAANQGCRLVVLPECLDLGWTHPSAREMAEPIPGAHSQRLALAASEAGLYVVAGLVERAADRLYNSAVLIDPWGGILLVHRKINELKIAQDLYSVGTQLAVANTELGTLGVNICADNFPDSIAIGRTLAFMGAQILLSPCCWAVEAEHDNRLNPYGDLWRQAYGELGRTCDLPVVGVSNVGRLNDGPWRGKKAIGCSLATGRHGDVLAECPYGESAETLVVVEVELRPQHSVITQNA